MEDALQEFAITFPFALLVDLVDAPCSPCVHRRIHITERPLVGGNLAVGVHVPLAQHERELLFREVGIHEREWNAVKRKVPGGIPRVFPFVRHGDHVCVIQMGPFVVAAFAALRGWGRIAGVALQPIVDDIVIELLRPQHARKTLTHDVLCIRRKILRNNRAIEFVGFALAESNRRIEAGKGILAFEIGVGQAQTDNDRLTRTNRELVVGCGLRADMLRIDRFRGAVNDVVVNAVFHVGRTVLDSKQSAGIGLVLGEEQLRRTFTMQPAVAWLIMIQLDHRVRSRACLLQLRPPLAPSPRPCVAEPHRRQKPKAGRFRPTVRDRDLDQDVFCVGLSVFDEHIEITIVVEYSCVQQFELRLVLPASPVFFNQLTVGKFRLGILVEVLHVGVRGGRVEVEVVLLYVLTMIALVARQAENPFFQDGVALVP